MKFLNLIPPIKRKIIYALLFAGVVCALSLFVLPDTWLSMFVGMLSYLFIHISIVIIGVSVKNLIPPIIPIQRRRILYVLFSIHLFCVSLWLANMIGFTPAYLIITLTMIFSIDINSTIIRNELRKDS